jgi:hypothetical protein
MSGTNFRPHPGYLERRHLSKLTNSPYFDAIATKAGLPADIARF